VLGGLGSIWGVVGAIVLSAIDDYLLPSVLYDVPGHLGLDCDPSEISSGVYGFPAGDRHGPAPGKGCCRNGAGRPSLPHGYMVVTMPTEPDRYDPLPSLLELPAFLLRKLPASRRRRVAIGGVLVAVAVAAAAAVVVPQMRSQQHDQAARAVRQDAAALAALKARYAREARPIQGRGPAAAGRDGAAALSVRRDLVSGLQAAVLADARDRADRGELHAHYRATTCSAYPKQVVERPPADDLTRATAVFECIAVSRTVAPDARTTSGSLIGQPYRARVDFTHGRYAFCKIVQQPGELSIQREVVLKVPRACGGKS
jgi:hypothetical protein